MKTLALTWIALSIFFLVTTGFGVILFWLVWYFGFQIIEGIFSRQIQQRRMRKKRAALEALLATE